MENFLSDLFADQSYDKENFLIAGPCVVESEELTMEVAGKVSGICKNLGIAYIFKSSYRKANRTSGSSFTGIGDEAALEIVKKQDRNFTYRLHLIYMGMMKQLLRQNMSMCCKFRPSFAVKLIC